MLVSHSFGHTILYLFNAKTDTLFRSGIVIVADGSVHSSILFILPHPQAIW